MGIMTKTTTKNKIEFARISIADRRLYEDLLAKEDRVIGESERGCEFSFVNLYLWGRQNIAIRDGHALLFSQFDRRSVYPYPVGTGDKKAAIDAIIEDSEARGIPCRITGLTPSARTEVEELFPGRFRFHSDEGSFDYVYSIDDLADLPGKKYDGKRNHLRRFSEAYPDFAALPIDDSNISKVRKMADEWYAAKLSETPDADFHMERAALEKALRDYRELSMEGLLILNGGKIIAFTLASRMSEDTFDVHFEKALAGVQGAYAIVNREFARYIREKYPNVRYLDREEDMGLEGLRRAKKSYHPHHQIKKCWACLLEDGYDY